MVLNVVLLSQIAGYSVISILVFCVNVPLVFNLKDFNDHCLLFSSGKWNQSNGQLEVEWSSKLNCDFPIFLNIVIAAYAFHKVYRSVCYVFREIDSSFLVAFFDVVFSLLFAILTILAACMVTFGFIRWCNAMIQRFPSCETSVGHQIDLVDKINTNNFYLQMGTAQFAIWAMFATWVGLSICALLKMWKYHQLDIIRSSMYSERQKLVQQDQQSISIASGPEGTVQTTATSIFAPTFISSQQKEF